MKFHSTADRSRRVGLREAVLRPLPGGEGALWMPERLAPLPVRTQEDLGYSAKAKEALAFAIIAHETLHGRPGNEPSGTGARRAAPLGKITPGDNYLSLVQRVAAAQQPG